MSVEDQFDVAAQDRRADAARKARQVPPYVYDRAAVIEAAKLAGKLEAVADEIEAEMLAAEQAEVPEVPGKVDQEPEIAMPQPAQGTIQEALVAPGFPCCDNPEPHAHQGGEPAAGG